MIPPVGHKHVAGQFDRDVGRVPKFGFGSLVTTHVLGGHKA